MVINKKHLEHLNFVHIRGNVGSVQLVPYGEKKQAALSVATNYGYMDKDGIALIETTWVHVTAIEGVLTRFSESKEGPLLK